MDASNRQVGATTLGSHLTNPNLPTTTTDGYTGTSNTVPDTGARMQPHESRLLPCPLPAQIHRLAGSGAWHTHTSSICLTQQTSWQGWYRRRKRLRKTAAVAATWQCNSSVFAQRKISVPQIREEAAARYTHVGSDASAGVGRCLVLDHGRLGCPWQSTAQG